MEINRQSGEKYLESNFPKVVFLIDLKNPTYLKSPIALIRKIDGIIQPLYFITHKGNSSERISRLFK